MGSWLVLGPLVLGGVTGMRFSWRGVLFLHDMLSLPHRRSFLLGRWPLGGLALHVKRAIKFLTTSFCRTLRLLATVQLWGALLVL